MIFHDRTKRIFVRLTQDDLDSLVQIKTEHDLNGLSDVLRLLIDNYETDPEPEVQSMPVVITP